MHPGRPLPEPDGGIDVMERPDSIGADLIRRPRRLAPAGAILMITVGLLAVLRLASSPRPTAGPEVPMGLNMISDECPACGHRYALSLGEEAACPGCGRVVASCGRCGRSGFDGPLTPWPSYPGAGICDECRPEEQWEAERLKEFQGPEANLPPPDTQQARDARLAYEARVRGAYEGGRWPAALFPPEAMLIAAPGQADDADLPRGVVEASGFYERAVEARDNGSVTVHRWDLGGEAIYVVRCTTDGSGGMVELYDAGGTPLGYARTDWDCPAWTTEGIVRGRAFGVVDDEVEGALRESVERLKGDSWPDD